MQVTRADAAIAASSVMGGLVVVALQEASGLGWAPPQFEAAVQVLTGLLTLRRRRSPVLVLVVCVAASFVTPVVATLAAAQAVGAYVRSPVRGAVATVGTLVLTLPALAVSSNPVAPGTVWLACATLVLAFMAGYVRSAQAQESDERERAALVQERERLARELHDVVAQRLSYMVIEADLIEATTSDPDVVTLADQVSGTGRAALVEMRTVIGALAEGQPTTNPAARLDELGQLVAQARSVGQPVELDVPPGVDLGGAAGGTALRVVGESLANAVRHAPGAATVVRIATTPGRMQVVVRNRPASRAPTGLTGGGHGLRALQRRVELLGGQLEAGRDADGGWKVDAWMPARTG